MAAVREILFGMKSSRNHFDFFVLSILFFVSAANSRAQPSALSSASSFTSVEYFDAPNQRQVKTRLSGAEAHPLPGGLLEVKQLKLESFATNGRPQVIITAPNCVYDQMNELAASPGHLQLRSGDGKFRLEGDGFLWRQADSFLTISNNVQTVIETAPEKKTAP
jgi:hypothetical protein